jgi:hypothetical protein
MIEVYIYPVTGKPYMKQISDSLEGLQQVVGGYIEVARHPATEVVSFAFNDKNPPRVLLIVNENGLLEKLPPNENIGGIVGQCFFIRDTDFK